MNKTIDISLAGILFHLEESAYYKLKKYLKAVRNSLQNTDDVDEVMNEIEARIAELLLQKQTHPQQVINEKNIEEIIAVMGQPEDYEEEAEPTPQPKGFKKALFRDMDHSVIAGVAAGLAHYLGIDVTLMRLIFIILLFVTHGSFILIYLLLWIVIPKAKTASDKLKMKGETVNVDNIVEQVEEEAPKKKVKIGETIENTTHEFGSILIKIIGFLLVLITGLVLISLLVSAVSIIPFAQTNLQFIDSDIYPYLNLPIGWIGVLSIILVSFPFLLLFILGFKMLFPNSKSFGKNFWLISGTIWFLVLLFFISKATAFIAQKGTTAKIVAVTIKIPAVKDTLSISQQDLLPHLLKNEQRANKHIRFIFHPATDTRYGLKIIKESQGKNNKHARENAREISFPYQTDSLQTTLTVSNYYSFPTTDFLANHAIYIHIYIPENKTVHLSKYTSQRSPGNCKGSSYIQNKKGKLYCDGQIYEEHDSSYLAPEENEIITINVDDAQIKITKNGVDIISNDKQDNLARIVIDKKGINIKAKEQSGDSAIMKIGENGIIIKTNENEQ